MPLEHFTLEMRGKDLQTNPCCEIASGELCSPPKDYFMRYLFWQAKNLLQEDI